MSARREPPVETSRYRQLAPLFLGPWPLLYFSLNAVYTTPFCMTTSCVRQAPSATELPPGWRPCGGTPYGPTVTVATRVSTGDEGALSIRHNVTYDPPPGRVLRRYSELLDESMRPAFTVNADVPSPFERLIKSVHVAVEPEKSWALLSTRTLEYL